MPENGQPSRGVSVLTTLEARGNRLWAIALGKTQRIWISFRSPIASRLEPGDYR